MYLGRKKERKREDVKEGEKGVETEKEKLITRLYVQIKVNYLNFYMKRYIFAATKYVFRVYVKWQS